MSISQLKLGNDFFDYLDNPLNESVSRYIKSDEYIGNYDKNDTDLLDIFLHQPIKNIHDVFVEYDRGEIEYSTLKKNIKKVLDALPDDYIKYDHFINMSFIQDGIKQEAHNKLKGIREIHSQLIEKVKKLMIQLDELEVKKQTSGDLIEILIIDGNFSLLEKD